MTTIPPFHFPVGKSSIKHDQHILNTITTVKQIYNYRPYLTESQFIPVSKACGLPRYLNMAFFRKLESIGKMETRVTFSAFLEGWTSIARNKFDDDSLFFNVLKKQNCNWISPEDLLPVLEDVVLNHPGLKFLGDNPLFQERYIETVICRIYYDGRCAHGRMTFSHFRNCHFTQMIKNLNPNVDLNNTRDCFSYKHFYVLYCKFWVLDEDHDLIISESDLLNYNDGLLSPKITTQIMLHGRISAFARDDHLQETVLTYLDYIWFLISETDKSTPVAIEYWFRCMDEDGDGVITTYDLSQHWNDQNKKLQDIIESYSDECIRFDDIICQMNDLIQPEVPGQFRLRDLKRNGTIAERFFDTFLNIEKFQIHDTYQGLIRSIHNQKRNEKSGLCQLIADHYRVPFSLGVWCDYAEQEYELLILSEQCGSDSDWSVQNTDESIENDFFIDPQESSDHESDSSAPSTPVMQESNQNWKDEKVNEKSNWIWHSVSP